jgi:hypothetical protein
MALLAALWSSSFRAEMVPEGIANLSQQYEYAKARGVKWLIIFNAEAG